MIGITGATGFVGKHLIEKLNKEQLVTIGRKQITNIKNIYFDFENDNNLEIPSSIHTIIHLAAITADDKSLESKKKINLVNILGTQKIIQAIKKSNVKKIIFLSTLKVYGEKNSANTPISIDSELDPKDEYSKSKIEAEKMIIKFSKDNNINYLILRPPMIYGPGNIGNFNLLTRILKLPFPMPFKSLDANRRSFLSVYNIVDFLIYLLNSKIKNQILLASDNDDLSTFKLIKLISQKYNLNKQFFYVNPSFLKMLFSFFGISQIFEKLNSDLFIDIEESILISGWKPKYNFIESLEQL